MTKQANPPAPQADADAAAVVLWYPSPVTARGIVALPNNVAGACVLGWGDNTYTETSGGAPASTHAYASGGAYKLTVYQDAADAPPELVLDTVYLPHAPERAMALIAEEQVSIRDGMAPTIAFAPDASNPNLIIATVNDQPARMVSEYEITWAAGEVETKYLPHGTTARHGFKAGTHTVTVRDLHTRRALTQDLEVKDKEYDPDFTFAKGANTMTVEITLSKVGTKKDVLIDWGDGDQTPMPAAEVGQKTSHPYLDANDYIVQCVYADGSTDGSARLVTVPFPARAAR